MNQPSRPFELVVDQAETPQAPPASPPQRPAPVLNRVAIEMMSMALSALGQKALVALSACFSLLLVGSTFVLWFMTPDPNPHQIASLSIYAAFVLAAIYLNRRK